MNLPEEDIPSPTEKSSSENFVALKPESYANKSIHSFTLNGHTHRVRGWDEFISAVCNQFAATHSADFEKVLWISDDQKPLFSRYSDQLPIPEKIKQTDIYVETKQSPAKIIRTVIKLLTEFGYGKDDLGIDAR